MSVSIVIPVYNAEKYLRKCLDSVCAQADCVTEIILVNDGSTDGSLNICTEYAQKDGRIKIIDKQNAGAEQAIIDGVNATTGEYIGFVDSDDYIEPNMYSELYDCIKRSGADIAFCRYKFVDSDYNFIRRRDLGMKSGVYDKADGRFPIMLLPTLKNRRYITGFRWNKLIARELLVNSIAFKQSGLRVGEDLALIIPTAMSASRIVYTDQCLYHYVQRDNSLTHTYTRRHLDDWVKTVDILEKSSAIYGYKFDNFGDSALALLFVNCLVSLRHSDLPRAQKKEEFKAIGNNPLVRKFLKEVKVDIEFKKKIVFQLLKHKMYGLLSLVYK